jgi:adenylate cyclase
MSETNSRFDYQVGGSLDSEAPSYVTRQADTVFYETLKAGRFCYVLNSRQMGKSSLRVRVMQRLQNEGVLCVFIDLTGMGTQDVTPEKWYAGIVQCLVSSCQLSQVVDWRTWWRERRDLLSPVQRLRFFIEEVVLVQIQQRIVIFVDEIDRVLSQNFSLDDFFLLVRSYALKEGPQRHRVTFALLGVATPSNLIQDKTQTPFNIGQAIELQGFQLEEAQRLTAGFTGRFDHPAVIMREILDWTGGQPFLTQRLCRLVINFLDHEGERLQSKLSEAQFVEQAVKSLILTNWEAQDEPEHLRTIQNRILRCDRRSSRLLGLYRKILDSGGIQADSSAEQMELRLSGLVMEQQGQLVVRNRIYEAVFNLAWIERKLAELRPYAEAITAWTESGGDCRHLLQGQALQSTLTWTLGKSLSDVDYQFIVASQEFAQMKVQTALRSATRASQLLATARQDAQQEVARQRPRWRGVPKVAALLTLLVTGLRLSGLLQGPEWSLLDQFFRWRPPESADSRIAIITISESDLAQVGQWPIPDRTLAEALTLIKAQQPRSIGLDLYRDLPVEPGHQALTALFRSTPNLFGVEKLVHNPIPGPMTLVQQYQIGFSDQVVDLDGKVRRALLSLNLAQDKQDNRHSLPLTLALHSLQAQGVQVQPLEHHQIRFGNTVIQRFESSDGGYIRADSGGYQILLNYRGDKSSFHQFSFRDLLSRKIPPQALRDRIVLIGSTAESLNDFFYTPFGHGPLSPPLRMSGVIVQANILSSLLSAAQGERPLLRTGLRAFEWAWILAWAMLGGILGFFLRSPIPLICGSLLSGAGLLGLCYLAFLEGWWLLGVAGLIALWGSLAVLRLADMRLRSLKLFHTTLAKLILIQQDYPTEGFIALEYFRQSESRDRQALIDQSISHSTVSPILSQALADPALAP